MGIEFNNENDFQQAFRSENNVKGLTGWLIKKGIAKDEKSAQIVMITITIICFAIAIFFAVN